MKIYTVVGEADYEGISELGPSFTNKEDAQQCATNCAIYDKDKLEASDPKEWRANHPLSTASNTCYGCDSYDVVEHELMGLIDITTSEDKLRTLGVIDNDCSNVFMGGYE